MAGGMDLGDAGKGKRPLDVTINLVPFIDLMAVTIVFLIMTAVWTQLGRLHVTQAGQVGEPSDGPQLPPVEVLLTTTEWKLSVGGTVVESAPLAHAPESGKPDLARLTKRLQELKQEWPDQSAVTLQAEDAVPYADLVFFIDACIGASFPGVTVAPAS